VMKQTYKIQEKYLKALEKALKCYIENISNIESSKESTEILINLYDSINALAYRYVKSEFLEDRSYSIIK